MILLARSASAKPTILVTAKIDPRDQHLSEKLTRDLRAQPGAERTPSQFIVETVLQELSGALGMFTFVSTSDRPDATLTLLLTSGDDRERYPGHDVDLVFLLSTSEPQVRMPLFRRAGCSPTPLRDCAPESLADSGWYREKLKALIRQWPPGWFKSIVLTRQARYEKGGKIKAREDIDVFGQRHGGPPTALFEILYGETQRQFAFCMRITSGEWKTLGRDQGEVMQPTFMPSCYVGPAPPDVPASNDGQITLLRAFLR